MATPEPAKGSPARLYNLTGALTSVAVSAANTYVPLYLRSLGSSYFVSGLPLVVRGMGRFAFDATSIYVMGSVRPHMILLSGVALGALALLACGVFPDAYPVIGAYFFIGAGMAMMHIALRQIVFEGALEGRRGHAMGILSVFIGTGPMLGIALGGYIAEYVGYRSLYFSAGGTILWLPFVLAYLSRNEISTAKDKETSTLPVSVLWQILGTSGAPLLCACSFFSLFYQQVRNLAVAFYATDAIGLSLASYGVMRSISQVGNVGGRYFGGGWTDRSGVGNCMVVGFVISSAGYALLSWSDDFWSLLLVHTTIGLGAGMVNVASQVGILSIVPSALRGQAMGLYRAVGDVGMLVGPVLITGSLEHLGFAGSFAWMAIMPIFLAGWAFLTRGVLKQEMR